MTSRMQSAASETYIMRRSGVCAPVSLQHDLLVWWYHLWNSETAVQQREPAETGRLCFRISPCRLSRVDTHSLPDQRGKRTLLVAEAKGKLNQIVRKYNVERFKDKRQSWHHSCWWAHNKYQLPQKYRIPVMFIRFVCTLFGFCARKFSVRSQKPGTFFLNLPSISPVTKTRGPTTLDIDFSLIAKE